MRNDPEVNRLNDERTGEKGAAMVMALLISFLLLVAGAGLLLESSMNAFNVTDATAEQQAYSAAESGIQSAVNVLRGNVVPNPLIDDTLPPDHKTNKISFVKAVKPATSNTGTTGLDAEPRFSRWLGYHGTFTDRVRLGDTATAYSPINGFAYSLNISDPDHTGDRVTYTTEGKFIECDRVVAGDPTTACADMPYPHVTWSRAGGSVRVTYIPAAVINQDVSGGASPVNFGKFKVEVVGTGAQIPAFSRFEIKIRMSQPYDAKKVIRGWIETNTGAFTTPPKVIVDSQTFDMMGAIINLNFNSGVFVNFPNDDPQRVGFEAPLALGDNLIGATMTSPEPVRLLIKSRGYGPRGAVKQLEAIIQKNLFNGLGAPATLTLVGPPCPSVPQDCFNPGSSNVTTYSGDDVVTTDIIPPIGTTNDQNLENVQNSVDGQPPHPFNGNVIGSPSNVSDEMPDWLLNPEALDAAVHSFATLALGSPDAANTAPAPYGGTRFFPEGVNPPTFGDNANGLGITFCDGDCTFTGPGGGLLIVTGKLTLHGNFNFRGLIIVTGQEGVDRSGGGNGVIQGNIVVAPYPHSQVVDTAAIGNSFLPPIYDLSGGGSSTITYNSSSVASGISAVNNFVLGVLEK